MTPHPVFDAFAGLYEFGLDPFQVRSCHVVEEGKGVLVAAPTGSGKTVVGEFAVHLALETGRKAFYTTPIKALSNQKYHDLVARYGVDRVGLLTGDTSVNGEAPVVVMTTEVLRNMLYAGSGTLTGLGYVVMDEVHYLADRSRGAVWEEVIIHLPDSVALVSLSATVSNAEEFGEWLETVRGDTVTIVEERRPVPLYQHVLVGRRMLDLFATTDVDAAAGFVKEGAPGQRRARPDRPRRLGEHADARPAYAEGPAAARRPTPRGQRPTRLDPEPGRRARPARRRRPAARDRVHLQPGGMRRGGRAVPALGHPADDARGARRDPRLRRGGVRRPPGRGPGRPRLPRLPRRPHPRPRGPPRRDAAGVQAVRREALPARPVQGRVRHRDARARHQHAGPHGRPGEAVEVERRDPRRHHAGGVHPADGTRRPPRAGRRGSRGRALAARHQPRGGRRARLHPYLSAALELPPVVQHGGQPRAPGRPGPRAGAAGDVVRAVPGRQGRGRARATARQEPGRPRGIRRGRHLRPRRLHGVRRTAAARLGAGEERRARPVAPTSGTR